MAYIPNNLIECRRSACLNQLDVAKYLGLKSTDRISRWERGLTYPHLRNVLKLAKLYKKTVEELYPVRLEQ